MRHLFVVKCYLFIQEQFFFTMRPRITPDLRNLLLGKIKIRKPQHAKKRDVLQGVVEHPQNIDDSLYFKRLKISCPAGDMYRNSLLRQNTSKVLVPA